MYKRTGLLKKKKKKTWMCKSAFMSPAEWFTPQYSTWKGGFILHSPNLPVPQSLWTSIKPFFTTPRYSFHFYNSGMLYASRSSPSSASVDPVLSLWRATQMMYWPGMSDDARFSLFILFMQALKDVSLDWCVSHANVLPSLFPPASSSTIHPWD